MGKNRLKGFLLALWMMIFPLSAGLAASRPAWEADFGQALKRAAEEDKWVFASFYSTRCPRCEQMDREVFAKPEVVQLVSRFVPVKVNTDKEMEATLRYQVEVLPTNLVLDSEGNILDVLIGYVPVEDFVQRITPTAEGKNPLELLDQKAAGAPGSATTQIVVGYQFLQRFYYARSRPYLEKGYQLAAAKSNLREEGLRLLAASYLFDEDVEGAGRLIEKYREEFPKSRFAGPMYFDLGRINFEREAYEQAIANFARAKDLAEDFMLRVRANWMISAAKEKLGEKPQ